MSFSRDGYQWINTTGSSTLDLDEELSKLYSIPPFYYICNGVNDNVVLSEMLRLSSKPLYIKAFGTWGSADAVINEWSTGGPVIFFTNHSVPCILDFEGVDFSQAVYQISGLTPREGVIAFAKLDNCIFKGDVFFSTDPSNIAMAVNIVYCTGLFNSSHCIIEGNWNIKSTIQVYGIFYNLENIRIIGNWNIECNGSTSYTWITSANGALDCSNSNIIGNWTIKAFRGTNNISSGTIAIDGCRNSRISGNWFIQTGNWLEPINKYDYTCALASNTDIIITDGTWTLICNSTVEDTILFTDKADYQQGQTELRNLKILVIPGKDTVASNTIISNAKGNYSSLFIISNCFFPKVIVNSSVGEHPINTTNTKVFDIITHPNIKLMLRENTWAGYSYILPNELQGSVVKVNNITANVPVTINIEEV